jgi:prepilin-type processing-associated H-X9-DG protein
MIGGANNSAGRSQTRNFSEVVDGTSNTMIFSEGTVAVFSTVYQTIARGVYRVEASPEAANSAFFQQCRAARGSNGQFTVTTVSTSAPTPRVSALGTFWADGGTVAANVFHAIFPPNHPSCDGQTSLTASATATGQDHNRPIVSASSFHPGGVNVALVDGSVRFVSDNIDNNGGHQIFSGAHGPEHNFNNIGGLGVPSPFGVWGAYGSVNGGEVVPPRAKRPVCGRAWYMPRTGTRYAAISAVLRRH